MLGLIWTALCLLERAAERSEYAVLGSGAEAWIAYAKTHVAQHRENETEAESEHAVYSKRYRRPSISICIAKHNGRVVLVAKQSTNKCTCATKIIQSQ